MDHPGINESSTPPQHSSSSSINQNEGGIDREGLEAGLAQAIARVHGRSKTAQLRAWFPVIENARLRGVPIAEIVEELAKQGLEIKERTFEVIMSRLRKRGCVDTTAMTPSFSATPNPAPSKPTSPRASGVDRTPRLTPEKLKQIREDDAGMDQYTC